MRKYNEARRERTEAARNALQERAHAAADTLATIMQDADAPAQTRVSAAAEILRQTVKYTEITDIMQQLDELEARRSYSRWAAHCPLSAPNRGRGRTELELLPAY